MPVLVVPAFGLDVVTDAAVFRAFLRRPDERLGIRVVGIEVEVTANLVAVFPDVVPGADPLPRRTLCLRIVRMILIARHVFVQLNGVLTGFSGVSPAVLALLAQHAQVAEDVRFRGPSDLALGGGSLCAFGERSPNDFTLSELVATQCPHATDFLRTGNSCQRFLRNGTVNAYGIIYGQIISHTLPLGLRNRVHRLKV